MHESHGTASIPERLSRVAIPFGALQDMPISGLLKRIGDARLVMIGEASHGTSEFYAARALITRHLIEREHFNFVAIEGDWPDASRVDRYVRHRHHHGARWTAFARFPTWMWRNDEVRLFVDWLRHWNLSRPEDRRVGFHGLDLYSLYTSIDEVLAFLWRRSPELAHQSLEQFRCLLPYRDDPIGYARAALRSGFRNCEDDVMAMLAALYHHQRELDSTEDDALFDTLQNAHLVASAEEYYRTMFFSDVSAWNLRDSHMFATLKRLFHDSGVPRAILPMRRGDPELMHLLRPQRLQRAIGVIYRPDTERHSHYYHASLPRQFDEYIWFDKTQAVTPLKVRTEKGLPDTYPFGL